MMNLITLFVCIIISFGFNSQLSSAKTPPKVIEMDDRLIEYTTQSKWLITFYAPWCQHCRKLEPIMDEIAKYYDGKLVINIARIDATRFLKAAEHFQIRAYPTIKFIYGKTNLNYTGERRKEDLIDFVSKADAYRVTKAYHQLDFEHNKIKHKHFFLIVGTVKDEKYQLFKDYVDMANKYFLDAYFFYAHPDHVAKTATVKQTPKIGVIKENEFYYFDSNKMTLEEFIKKERFFTFQEVTMSNFPKLLETKKILIIINIDPDDKSKEKQSRKIRQNFKIFSKTSRLIYHEEFQFGYTENVQLLSGIAIWKIPSLSLFIFNTTTFQYVSINLIDAYGKVIDLDIEELIEEIRQNKIQFYGGFSYFNIIRRPFWEIYRAIIEMFIEAPIISSFLFGLPLGVILLVCYFLCFNETTEKSFREDVNDSDKEDEHQFFLNEASRLHSKIIEKKIQQKQIENIADMKTPNPLKP